MSKNCMFFALLSAGLFSSSDQDEPEITILTKSGESINCRLKTSITLECQLGTVAVDIKSIEKIRVCGYRKDQKAILLKSADNLVTKLGDDDFLVRERAHKDLKSIGKDIVPFLNKHKDNKDLEVKTRVLKILEDITSGEQSLENDSIMGDGLLLKGWLKDGKIRVKAEKELDLNLDDIEEIIFKKPQKKGKNDLTIMMKDGSVLSGKLADGEILLLADKKMSIKLKDVVEIQLVKLQDIVEIELGEKEDFVITNYSAHVARVELIDCEFYSQVGKVKLDRKLIACISIGSHFPTDSPNKVIGDHKQIRTKAKELLKLTVKEKMKKAPDFVFLENAQKDLVDNQLWDFGNKLYHLQYFTQEDKKDVRRTLEETYTKMKGSEVQLGTKEIVESIKNQTEAYLLLLDAENDLLKLYKD